MKWEHVLKYIQLGLYQVENGRTVAEFFEVLIIYCRRPAHEVQPAVKTTLHSYLLLGAYPHTVCGPTFTARPVSRIEK